MALKMTTYCNPLNLNYRFQARRCRGGACCREAADPSVVYYHGKYWLFASKSGGYWYSDDLKSWSFVSSAILPVEDYAPDVRVIDDHIWFTASNVSAPIFQSSEPVADKWTLRGKVSPHHDPNLFQDDDGRIYRYAGCSNSDPIRGVEIDRVTLQNIGDWQELIKADGANRGWERFGEDNRGDCSPWIEGPWMTKHNRTYYLQYAAPGTAVNVYADGVFTGKAPLGPFRYADHNPFSLKPGGFITGAGHGSTFQDQFGNWWHTSTMRISVKHKFERRIGLFPAGFDDDGIMFCNTTFADYPTRVPAGRWNPWTDPFAGWMLLSYHKPVKASSSNVDYPPSNAVDEDVRSYWAAVERAGSHWIEVDLGESCEINAVQINFAEHECEQYMREGEPLRHCYKLDVSSDSVNWNTLIDKTNNKHDVPHDYVELPCPATGRFARLSILHMPGRGYPAVSGLRVFGRGKGASPATVNYLTASRRADDPRTADVKWEQVEGADGYVVYWGIAPEKLYSCWQVLDQCNLELRALNVSVPVWVAIEAFNANGRSVISRKIKL